MAETKTLAVVYKGIKKEESLTNPETGTFYLYKFREKTGVKLHQGPFIEYFKPGYTVAEIIGQSHIALSTWPEDNEATLTAEIYRGTRTYDAIRFLFKELDADECKITETRYYNSGHRVLKRTLKRR